MNHESQHNQLSQSINWMRTISAYATTVNGVVFCAIAFFILFSGKVSESITGFIWIFLALLILWIAWGLIEGNSVSWKIFQAVGAMLIGATGIVLVLYGVQDYSRWSPVANGSIMFSILLWLFGGVVLFCWATAQVAELPIAEMAWLATSIPFGVILIGVLIHNTISALAKGQQLALIASVIPIVACLVAFRILVRPQYHTLIDSLVETDELLQGGKRFPTHFHELLARGRLCEVFELPCTEACPLATKVARQYQQLRQKHQDSPQALEALEKAYSILITPRSRELCGLAHEVMDAQHKQLGDKVFKSVEMLLWTKLWNRLQSNEFKGDPEKVKKEKLRLIKKI